METSQTQDPGKTVAILSYITLIGFIIAIVMHNDERNKSELGAFHLRQAIGLFCTAIAMSIAQVIFLVIPIIGWLISGALSLCMIALFIFWILGLVSAINQEKKEVPIIGGFIQDLFKGIK